MSKKILYSLGLVFTVSILAVNSVFAATNNENLNPPRSRLIVGEIIAVESDQFKVMSRTAEFTLNITDNSRFWIPAEGAVGSDSLEVGRRMVVFAQNAEQGDWNARLVIFLPMNLNLPWRLVIHKAGIVTRVDQQAENFSIRTPTGRSFTFSVDENTRFKGQLSDLEDMKGGTLASVVGRRLRDGTLLARAVSARKVPEFIR